MLSFNSNPSRASLPSGGIKLARHAPGFILVGVRRCLFAAVILVLLATGLRAETYREWEQLTPDAKPIPFKQWLAPSTEARTIEEKSYSTFQAPLGHLFGHLDLSAFPPGDFPLRLRVLYYRVGQSDVDPMPNGMIEKRLGWTSPLHYVSDQAGPGDLVESRESDIANAAEGGAVPLWSIQSGPDRERYGDNGTPYSVLIEVASRDGTVLARKQLIEAVNGGTIRNANLAKTDSGGEVFMKSLNQFNTVSADVLPVETSVYEDVRILWLDPGTLHDPAYPDSFWHGVFLAGTTVIGHDAEVQELAQRLGISPNQRVLQGGLWTEGHPYDDLSRQVNNTGSQFIVHIDKGENPFKKMVVMGRRRIHELRAFSIWFLVVFTVFEIAIIVGSLYLLHGKRRVFRWLLIPFSAIVYTALGLILVHFVVDFRPEVEIFREIDSVEGWPESLVSTDVTRLAFDANRTGFTAPPQAQYRWSSIDEANAPWVSVPGDKQMNFSMRQRYGRFAISHIRYPATSESPCQMTEGHVVATRPLGGAWIWDGKVWRTLGPMEPGKPVDIGMAPVIIDPSKPSHGTGVPVQDGNPYPYEDSFPETVRDFCSTGYMDSLKGTNVGLLLAIDPQVPPEQMQDEAESEIRTQTLLVHQFPLVPTVTTRP